MKSVSERSRKESLRAKFVQEKGENGMAEVSRTLILIREASGTYKLNIRRQRRGGVGHGR